MRLHSLYRLLTEPDGGAFRAVFGATSVFVNMPIGLREQLLSQGVQISNVRGSSAIDLRRVPADQHDHQGPVGVRVCPQSGGTARLCPVWDESSSMRDLRDLSALITVGTVLISPPAIAIIIALQVVGDQASVGTVVALPIACACLVLLVALMKRVRAKAIGQYKWLRVALNSAGVSELPSPEATPN